MSDPPDSVDRRPVPARGLAVSRRLADACVRAGIGADAISWASLACALLAAAALALTPYAEGWRPALWLAAALLVEARLIANMLDGMVALATTGPSAKGELMNEMPDRASDVAVLAALGYAQGGSAVLGWIAAALAIGTAYVRVAGKAAGAVQSFAGPMAKPTRMHVVAALGVALAIMPDWAMLELWQGLTPPRLALAIVAVGAVLTIVVRLRAIGRSLIRGRA